MTREIPDNKGTGGYLRTSDVIKRYTKPNGDAVFSAQTLSNWRRDGKGPPFIEPEGHPLYPLSDLLKWEAETKLSPTKQPTSADA